MASRFSPDPLPTDQPILQAPAAPDTGPIDTAGLGQLAPPVQQPGLFGGPQGFLGGIGRIGDALALAGGKTPVYQPYQDQQTQRNALSTLLTDPNNKNAFADLYKVNPLLGLQIKNNMQQQQTTQNKQYVDAINNIAGHLKQVQDQKGDVLGTFDQLAKAGYLQAAGIDPAHMAAVRNSLATDPGFLSSLVAPEKGIAVGGDLLNPLTGAVMHQGNVKLGEGESLLAAGAPGATTAPVGASSPSASTATNNGGALRWDGKSQWQGMTNVNPKPGDFVQFDTQANGDRAAVMNIQNQAKLHGINTLAGLLSKYAPSGDGSNNPAAYATTVGKSLGINPNTPIDLSNPTIAANIYQKGIKPVENMGASGSQPVAAAVPTAAGYHVVAQGATRQTQILQPTEVQQLGLDPSSVWQRKKDGTVEELSGSQSLTGPALERAAQIYNATGNLPQNMGRNGTVQRAIVERATQLSSGQNADDIVSRQAAYKADQQSLGTLTKQATTIMAAENAAQANGKLALSLAPAVGNGNIPIFNAWKSAANKNTGDPAISKLNAAVDTFANEYAAVIGRGTPTDALRQHAHDAINTAQSPQQFSGVIQTLSQDMANRRAGFDKERQDTLARMHSAFNPTAPTASAMPTATGPGGKKVQWNGKGWVPFNG